MSYVLSIFPFPRKAQSAVAGAKPLWRNKGTHSVISGVAKVPTQGGKTIFVPPPTKIA